MRDRGDEFADAHITDGQMQREKAYLGKGRAHASMTAEALNQNWVAAFKAVASTAGAFGDDAWLDELFDLGTELRLRGVPPPEHLVPPEARAALQRRFRGATPEGVEEAVTKDIGRVREEVLAMTTYPPSTTHGPELPQPAELDPWSATTAGRQQPFEPTRPPRPTAARLRTYFLRHFERSGSVAEAAARAGISPKTVRRWRASNPRFARRYSAILERRFEMIEDTAVHRAFSVDRRSVFHRGRAVGTVERHNDIMLMRLLARFDRIREREAARPKVPTAAPDLRNLTDLELLHFMGWPLPPGKTVKEATDAACQQLLETLQERAQKLQEWAQKKSPSKGQAIEPGVAK